MTAINSEVIADIQRLLNRDHGFSLKVDGDLGPETFWDSGKTTNAILDVLEKVGGPLAKAPDPEAAPVTSKRSVFLEIGHGPHPSRGYDPGAVRGGGAPTEHELNGIVGEAMKERLGELGIACVLDRDPSVKNYSSGQQARGHDVLISIHHNSHTAGSKAQGAEALHDPRSQNPKSDTRLCRILSRKLADANDIPDRGEKHMKLSVLSGGRSVGVPYSALIECFFVQSRPDDNPATSEMEDWSRRAGRAAAEGVAEFLKTV